MVKKEFLVSAIENGTVIDHIPVQSVFQVVKILNLDQFDNQVLFGSNLESKKLGRKGIIKVSNKFFKPEEINKIALVAPQATLIVIKNYQVVEKKIVTAPEEIINMVKCFNPNCITNHETIVTKFKLIATEEDYKLQCHYCEKTADKKNITFL